MKVYRAETGRKIDCRNTANIKTVNNLKERLENECGVPADEQILMTSFGTLVKEDNLTTVLESKGKDEYIVFCYDRNYLHVDRDNIDALLNAETPCLQPKVPQIDGTINMNQFKNAIQELSVEDACNESANMFARFDSLSQSIVDTAFAHTELANNIVEEQKLQSMALNVAMTNLDSYKKTTEYSTKTFIKKAKMELNRQKVLLDAIDNDIRILKGFAIHPSIVRVLDTKHRNKRRLIDFVDMEHVDACKSETRLLCTTVSQQIDELQQDLSILDTNAREIQNQVLDSSDLHSLDSTLADIKLSQERIELIRNKMKRDFQRIYRKLAAFSNVSLTTQFSDLSLADADVNGSSRFESSFLQKTPSSNTPRKTTRTLSSSEAHKMFEAFTQLAMIHIKEYLPKMARYEREIRQNTRELIARKRNTIESFVLIMEVIANFQRHASEVRPIVDDYLLQLDEFGQKYQDRDLESVRDILFAYGAIMIELVRRKEYAALLVANSNSIADVLGQYRINEEERRDHFRHKVAKFLPFKLTIIDKASPQCEISVNGVNSDDGTDLTKHDIAEFISIVTQVYSKSPQIANSSRTSSTISRSSKLSTGQNQDDEPFLTLLKNMVKQMDEMKLQFLLSIKETLYDKSTQGLLKELKSDPDTLDLIQPQELTQSLLLDVNSVDERFSKLTSPTASMYQLVDNEKTLQEENTKLKASVEELTDEVKSLRLKMDSIKEDNILLEQRNAEQADEVTHLKDIIKNMESEKEEYESEKRSFLNEIKNKDKSAEFRIASVEEDYNAKISDLQYKLEEEIRMKKNLEIEHASELNSVYSERAELHRRQDQLRETLDTLKEKLETERVAHEDQLSALHNEMEKKDKANEEIRERQEEFRSMMKRAEDLWYTKDEELKKIKEEQHAVDIAIRGLLTRFRPSDPDLQCFSLDAYVNKFKENLESFEKEYTINRDNLEIATQALAEETEKNKSLIDEHDEWRSIASRMSDKLEDFRKNVVFEIVNQLQLPMETEELHALKKKVTPSDDDTIIWNQILSLSSAIDTRKFVVHVVKCFRDTYSYAVQYKKKYHSAKEKYDHLCRAYCEKIAFRNFSKGDVALFLPTRNSTGKPWAAFNINAPHYFLRSTDNIAAQMQSREWIVARIVSITEYITDEADPDSNPYGLANGVKYYLVEAENWRNNKQHVSKKRHISNDSGLASINLPPEAIKPPSRPVFGSTSSSSFVHSYTTK